MAQIDAVCSVLGTKRRMGPGEAHFFCDCQVIRSTLQFSPKNLLFLYCCSVWSLGPTLFLCYLRPCLEKINISQTLKNFPGQIVQITVQILIYGQLTKRYVTQ